MAMNNKKPITKMKTGYCAANYTKTDTYDTALCGPIRATSEEAQEDANKGDYQGVRYVHTDGYLYVDMPEEE